MMTDEEIQQLVTPILQERLGKYGFERAEVKSGLDHDGDPVLFVTARYRMEAPELDATRALEAMVEISDLLRAKGETRFSHLTHFHPDDVPLDDESPRARQPRRGLRR
jgi:hypothetical protein